MNKKMKKKIMMMLVLMALVLAAVNEPALMVYAEEAEGDVVGGAFTSLTSIVTSFVSGLGTLVSLWGLSEWGMAFQGNDGMMQTHSFKRIAGGLVMCISPQILPLLVSA